MITRVLNSNLQKIKSTEIDDKKAFLKTFESAANLIADNSVKNIENCLDTYSVYFLPFPNISLSSFEEERVQTFTNDELILRAIESFAIFTSSLGKNLSSLFLSYRYILTLLERNTTCKS